VAAEGLQGFGAALDHGGFGGGACGGTGEVVESGAAGTGGGQEHGGGGTKNGVIGGFGLGAGFSGVTFGGGGLTSTDGHRTGGGGGGWYGGGTSNYGSYNGGGGGGSGYVLTASSYKPTGYLLGSEYYLSNAQTIGGNQSFPAPGGGNETGHSGNGYARITLVE